MKVCNWTNWEDDENDGKVDYTKLTEEESVVDIKAKYPDICGEVVDIECRIQSMPDFPIEDIVGQEVTCDTKGGLVCHNNLRKLSFCHNYEARIRCCRMEPCATTTVPTAVATTTAPTTTVITETTITPSQSTVSKTSTTTELTTTTLKTPHGTTRK